MRKGGIRRKTITERTRVIGMRVALNSDNDAHRIIVDLTSYPNLNFERTSPHESPSPVSSPSARAHLVKDINSSCLIFV
jgi:hypothetical protein